MGEKSIGIIGGMGPDATVDLFKKIIRSTPATSDQEHIRIIIDNNPKIPDRQKAIFERAADPAPAITATARNLEKAGADLLLIACNSAHHYFDAITESVSIPVLNIMTETAVFCRQQFPSQRFYGLLAGDSTIKLGLYVKAFEQASLKILAPTPEDQKIVLECIYAVKAGEPTSKIKPGLLAVVQNLGRAGAEAIILGCTEIPIVLQNGDHALPFIDATDVLAKAAVAKVKA